MRVCLNWDFWDWGGFLGLCGWKILLRRRKLPVDNPKTPPQSQKSQFKNPSSDKRTSPSPAAWSAIQERGWSEVLSSDKIPSTTE